MGSKVNFINHSISNPSNGCAVSKSAGTQDERNEEEGKIKFRISVFYDGTGNNKLNTVARRMYVKQLSEDKRKKLGVVGEIVNNEVGLTEGKTEGQEPELQGPELLELQDAFSYRTEKELKKKIKAAKEYVKENIDDYIKSSTAVSYLGAETNVYKMFRDLKECTTWSPKKEKNSRDWSIFKKFYIEGIGTIAGERDRRRGGGLGWGKSGIIERVKQAKGRVEDFIIKTLTEFVRDHNEFNLKRINIEPIEVDFFGFSRGAACARYSCKVFKEGDAWVLPPPVIFIKLDKVVNLRWRGSPPIDLNMVTIKNVGIFDTVVSQGLWGTVAEGSDKRWLSQDSIVEAEKVYHITSDDEYRVNFALTNNNSKGVRLKLPGAHSDIGGGYNNIESEIMKPILKVDDFAKAKSIAFWFKNNGWVESVIYDSNGTYALIESTDALEPADKDLNNVLNLDYAVLIRVMYIHVHGDPEIQIGDDVTLKAYEIILNRSKIYNDYSRISLNHMKKQFTSDLVFNYDPKDIELGKTKNGDDLNDLNNLIPITKSQETEKTIKITESEKTKETINKFRLKYMHFSADKNVTMFVLEAYKIRKSTDEKAAPFIRKEHDG